MFFERRGSLTQNRRGAFMLPFMLRKTTFFDTYLGPWGYSSGRNLIFGEVGFRVRYGAPQLGSLLRKNGASLLWHASNVETKVDSDFIYKYYKNTSAASSAERLVGTQLGTASATPSSLRIYHFVPTIRTVCIVILYPNGY